MADRTTWLIDGLPSVEHCTCRRTSAGVLARVTLTGEVDLRIVPALATALSEPAGAATLLVVLDMRDVTFLDVCVVRVLLDAEAATRRRGGRLVILRGAVPFDWYFTLLGVRDRLEVTPVRELEPSVAA